MSDARNRDKARLIILIGDYMAARRSNSNRGKKAVTKALQTFAQKTAFPNLATKANATIAVASIDDMREGLLRMSEIADQLSPLRQTLQAGAEIADSGQASLFFPRVASTLVQAEELLNSLLSTVEIFKAEIESVQDDFDLAKVTNLIEKVKSASDELGEKIGALGA
jgi:hypothetical protein